MKKSYSESSIKGVSPFIGESKKSSQRSLGSSRRISVASQVAPPVIEEPNPLLEDVRLRLTKLRKQQRIEEIEERHVSEQKRMEHDLLEAEVQDIISKKIKEMTQLEEDSQNNSLQSSPLRCGKSRGRGHFRHASGHHSGYSTPVIAHDCTPQKKSPQFPHNSNPRSRPTSGINISFSSISPISPAAATITAASRQQTISPSPSVPSLRNDSDDTPSEIDNNSLNSLSYNSTLTSTGRPMLIIVKKMDIDKQKILETVQEKLPSPISKNTESLTPTAAFPASLIYRPDYPLEPIITSSSSSIENVKHDSAEVELGGGGGVVQRAGAMIINKNSSHSLAPLSSSSKSDYNDDNFTTTNTTSSSNNHNYINNKNNNLSCKSNISSKKHSTNNSATSSNNCSLKKAVSDISTLLRSNEDIDNTEKEEEVVEEENDEVCSTQHIQHAVGEALQGLSVRQLRGSLIRHSQQQLQLQQGEIDQQLQQPGNPSSEEITSYTYDNNNRKSIRRRGTNIRSSQQFRLHCPVESTNQNLAELQGTSILEARFGGWASPIASKSTKHSGASTFY